MRDCAVEEHAAITQVTRSTKVDVVANEFFHPEFIAATGTEKTLPPLIHQFGVLRSFQEPDEDGNYFVDHTTALLLTDPQARFVGIFQQPHVIEQIIRQFNSIHSFVEAL